MRGVLTANMRKYNSPNLNCRKEYKWNEADYTFSSNMRYFSTVLDLLSAMIANAENNYERVRKFNLESVQYPFFLPVSPNQVASDFGNGAFQLQSGKSIVIQDLQTCCFRVDSTQDQLVVFRKIQMLVTGFMFQKD